ncbi:MAG: hypothetical protein IKR87_04755, partial [Candidatus Methanomethylophilaceae archaeon]|nr:hypothetical protein [Candidatus Methanomethylophilaceae archaeon]
MFDGLPGTEKTPAEPHSDGCADDDHSHNDRDDPCEDAALLLVSARAFILAVAGITTRKAADRTRIADIKNRLRVPMGIPPENTGCRIKNGMAIDNNPAGRGRRNASVLVVGDKPDQLR